MFRYRQSTGEFLEDGALLATGYSGTGAGRNNPDMQAVRNVGPIPRGEYSIGPAYKHPAKGPLCMRLTPVGHDALKRSGFLIHGDNKKNDASQGCIILGPDARTRISKAADRRLTVET